MAAHAGWQPETVGTYAHGRLFLEHERVRLVASDAYAYRDDGGSIGSKVRTYNGFQSSSADRRCVVFVLPDHVQLFTLQTLKRLASRS